MNIQALCEPACMRTCANHRKHPSPRKHASPPHHPPCRARVTVPILGPRSMGPCWDLVCPHSMHLTQHLLSRMKRSSLGAAQAAAGSAPDPTACGSSSDQSNPRHSARTSLITPMTHAAYRGRHTKKITYLSKPNNTNTSAHAAATL